MIVLNDFNNYRVGMATPKRMIVVHGTGGGCAIGAISWWKTRMGGNGTISTHYVIDRDGTTIRLYPTEYWGDHAGRGFMHISQYSVGIELVCWNGIRKDNEGKFRNDNYREISPNEVVKLNETYKGFNYYHNITIEQRKSLLEVIDIEAAKWKIPLRLYKKIDNVELTKGMSFKGILTHSSFNDRAIDFPPEMMDII